MFCSICKFILLFIGVVTYDEDELMEVGVNLKHR
jgi:hypothetical protein